MRLNYDIKDPQPLSDVQPYDAVASHVTGFAFDLSSQPDAPDADFFVQTRYGGGYQAFGAPLAFEPKHNRFALGDLESLNAEKLTPDLQSILVDLSWSVSGSGVETPVTFCIKNLVALRQ